MTYLGNGVVEYCPLKSANGLISAGRHLPPWKAPKFGSGWWHVNQVFWGKMLHDKISRLHGMRCDNDLEVAMFSFYLMF